MNTPLSGLRRRDTVSNLPPGLDLTRAAIAMAVAGNNRAAAEVYAANRWGANSQSARRLCPQ